MYSYKKTILLDANENLYRVELHMVYYCYWCGGVAKDVVVESYEEYH